MANNSDKLSILKYVSLKYLSIFIQIFFNAILARLLSPNEYGVLAIIFVFSSLFQIFSDMGLTSSIIQNSNLNSDDYDNLFSINFFIGISISVLFVILLLLLSHLYDEKVYFLLGIVMSISIFFNSLSTVHNALLLKQKKFKFISYRKLIITIFSGLSAIYLANNGFSYYSIALQTVLVGLSLFVWNQIIFKLKIVNRSYSETISIIWNYSIFQFSFNFINFLSRNLDNFLIGTFISTSNLGYYDRAYKTMKYPLDNITNIITPLLHPILAEHQHDYKIIYFKYLKVIKFISYIAIFISIYSYFMSYEIILILYGDQWIESIQIFKILAPSIFFQMIVSPASSIFQSINNTKKLFYNGLLISIVAIIGIIYGVYLNSIELVALAITLSSIFSVIVTYHNITKLIFKKNIFMFLKSFNREIILSLLVIIIFSILEKNIFSNLDYIFVVNFSIKSTTLLLIYLVISTFFGTTKNIMIRRGS